MKEGFNKAELATKIITSPHIIPSLIEMDVGFVTGVTAATRALENNAALEAVISFTTLDSVARYLMVTVSTVIEVASNAGISPTVSLMALGLISAAGFIDGAHRIQKTMRSILDE